VKKNSNVALFVGSGIKFLPGVAVNGKRIHFCSVAHPDMRKTVCFIFVAVLPLLSACDRLADMLEIPDPGKEAANAKAIGSACRQTGRSIEDCYALHPESQKADILSGWKLMNEYMAEHSLKEVPSVVSHGQAPAPHLSLEPVQPAVTHVPQPQVAVQ